MYYLEFASIMREKRKHLGLRQKDVCLMARIMPSRYSRIEHGSSEPTFSELLRISKVLRLDLTRILNILDDEDNDFSHIVFYD